MADDITTDEQRLMEFRAYMQNRRNRVDELFKRMLARMDDMTSGSGDAEAAVIEATNQSKSPRFKELKKLETKVSKLRAEIQRMKTEGEEIKFKLQLKENENKELRRALKEMEENQKQKMQIPTGWEIHGQKFNSIDHCEEWILSQPYDQVREAGDAGRSFVPGYSSDAIPDLPGFGDIDIEQFF